MDDAEKNPCSACMSRREVLRGGVAAAGAVSLLATMPAACMQASAAPSGPVPAGNVADIQAGTLTLVEGENVILGRDQGGLYAMTRVCTHQGQLVSVVSIGGLPALHCYAHGSEFSMNGIVTHGPAGRDLEHFQVDLGPDGGLTIQGGIVVTPATRTPVA
jgi:nitrite reductase/ring-hydroxylating ferredoxin subunit